MQTQSQKILEQRSKEMFGKIEIRKLVLPLIAEQTLAFSIGMIDTIMVARVGEGAVSGVSLVDAINFLLVTIFTALATGGAIVAGQYLGMGEKTKACWAAKHLVWVAFFASLLVTAACLLFNQQMLELLFGRVESGVMAHARTYFYVTALSYPFIAIYNAVAALFRSMGNGKVPMVNSLVMNVVNVIGNCIFIFGFGWGVFGAALATLISRIIATGSIAVMLRNPKLDIHLRNYSPIGLEFAMTKRILRIGIPTGLENSVFQLGRIIMTSLIATFGTPSITANAVGISLSLVGIIPGSALGLATLSVVARCVGAGEEAQANRYAKMLLGKAWRYMLVLNVLMLLLLVPILSLYQLSEETYQIAFRILVIHGVGAIVLWPPAFTLPNALRAAGDVGFTMVISIFSMFVFRIGCSYLLAYFTSLGVLSVWIAMLVDWSFRSLCFLLRWRGGKWKTKRVIQ